MFRAILSMKEKLKNDRTRLLHDAYTFAYVITLWMFNSYFGYSLAVMLMMYSDAAHSQKLRLA